MDTPDGVSSGPASGRPRRSVPLARLTRPRGGNHAGRELAALDVQTVLDALPYYVMLVDAQHQIVLANKAVQSSLGVDPTAIIGGYCPHVVHGCDGPYPGCPLEDAVARGVDVECDLPSEEGDRIFKSAVFRTPYETPEGDAIYLHTTRDITDQRKAEKKLGRSYEIQSLINELLRIALEPIPLEDLLAKVLDLVSAVPWLAFEPRGAIFVVDDATGMLCMKAQRGLDARVQVNCAALPVGHCVCGRAAAAKTVQFARHPPEHGDPRPNHGHYSVPIVQGEEVLGVLSVYVAEGHVTEPSEDEFLTALANVLGGIIQRERANELQKKHEKIALSRERMARMGEIAAGVAHTVRNPLHGVINCVDMLEAQLDTDDPGVEETLSLMREGMTRIDKVTRRLLMLTRDEHIARHPASARDLLDDVEALMHRIAGNKGVALGFESSCDCEILLDADRVVEALSNVVGNAIDATPAGGKVEVTAQLSEAPSSTLVIEVADTGEGIPQANLARVLDPFFTTKPIGEGSGLGLAIARQVLEQHDGRIEIESREGVGTRIRLYFPRAAAGD